MVFALLIRTGGDYVDIEDIEKTQPFKGILERIAMHGLRVQLGACCFPPFTVQIMLAAEDETQARDAVNDAMKSIAPTAMFRLSDDANDDPLASW